MRIAIISDTHDNLMTFEKFLKWASQNNIEQIIHCGDLTDFEFLNFFCKNFNGKIYLTDGNADEGKISKDLAESFENVQYFENHGEIEIDGIKIVFSHYPEIIKEIALQKNIDYGFHGHTHKPWQEKVNNTLISNPGTLGGVFYRASFAVLDTKNKKLELKILDQL